MPMHESGLVWYHLFLPQGVNQGIPNQELGGSASVICPELHSCLLFAPCPVSSVQLTAQE